MTVSTKLEKKPDYMSEYNYNKSILREAIATQLQQIKEFFKKNECVEGLDKIAFDELYITYRNQDLLVSITDDVIRYSTYHRIKQVKVEGTNEMRYSVSKPVRAAIFVKWVLKSKPCIADYIFNNNAIYNKFSGEDMSAKEYFRKGDNNVISFCNEHLALFCAFQIMQIYLHNEELDISYIAGVREVFEEDELPNLFYILRYRIFHQDTFTPILKKVFSDYSNHKEE